jgi:hypothetical protein
MQLIEVNTAVLEARVAPTRQALAEGIDAEELLEDILALRSPVPVASGRSNLSNTSGDH